MLREETHVVQGRLHGSSRAKRGGWSVYIIFSSIFIGVGVMFIGLKSVRNGAFTFLGIAVMIALFQIRGTSP